LIKFKRDNTLNNLSSRHLTVVTKWLGFFFVPSNLFWISVFCIVPFIQNLSLLDVDLVPKYIAFTILLGGTSVVLLFNEEKLVLLTKNTLAFFIVLLLYVFTVFISLIKSVNPGDAFYDVIRMVLPFLFLFIVLALFKINKSSIVTILKVHHVAVFVFISFGIMQAYSLREIHGHFRASDIRELSSTLGNKNFFSETILLLLPFSFAALLYLKAAWKYISGLSIVAIILSLVVLNTRSAQLGLIVAALSSFPLFITLNRRFKVFNRPSGIFILIFALCILVFSYTKTTSYERIKYQLQSSASWVSVPNSIMVDEKNTNSVFERLLLWKNSLLLAKEDLIAGSGLANWKLYYPKYGIGGARFVNLGAMHYEHPHNEYLLMMSERGVPSVLLWLVLLAIVMWLAIKFSINKINEVAEKVLVICMLGVIISFICISFFGYPLYRSYSPFLLMTSVAIIIHKYQEKNTGIEKRINFKYLFLFVLIFCCLSSVVLAKRFNSELLMRAALKEQRLNHFDRMQKLAAKADNYFFPVELTATPLSWYRGFGHYYNNKKDSALFYFKKAEESNPYHIQVLSDIGACYENEGNHAEAEKYLEKAVTITPLFPYAIENIAVVYINTGNIEKAYSIIHRLKKSNYRLPIMKAAMQKIVETNDDYKFSEYLINKVKDNMWLQAMDEKSDTLFSDFKNQLEKEYTASTKK
jgi:O-antigen ligase